MNQLKFISGPLRLGALIILLGSIGCGPKVVLSPELKEKPHAAVAFLPIAAPENARLLRVQYLRQSLQSELKNRGYTLMDETLVQRICADITCSNRNELVAKYPALEGFITLDLESFSRNNFGLGYYNTIAGTMRLTSLRGSTLAEIEHRESERGGVVFDSGQVVQGIIDQVNNFGDDKFNRLADKFARTVAIKFPAPPQNKLRVEQSPSAIEEVDLRQLDPDVYQVCTKGSPASTSSVIVGRVRTRLREVSPGQYCGILRLAKSTVAGGELTVELRSPFGLAARRPISLTSAELCDLNGRVKATRKKNTVTISIACAQTLATPTASEQGSSKQLPIDRTTKASMLLCDNANAPCAVERFIVYRAPSQGGPYEKIREMKVTSWTDRLLTGNTPAIYSVVSVDSSGLLSRPVSVIPQAETSKQ